MGLFDWMQRVDAGDPKAQQQLQNLSQFLLNFGQGVTAANQQGMSPFTSIAAGFGAGGQGINALDEQRLKRKLQELQLQEAQARAAERQRETAASQRVSDFTTTAQGPVNFSQSRLGALAQQRGLQSGTDVRALAAQMGLPPDDPRVEAIADQSRFNPLDPSENQFTLNPGDVRFNAQGQPIASVPPRPEKPEKITPNTQIAKIAQDVQRGLISPERGQELTAIEMAAERAKVTPAAKDEFTRNLNRMLTLESEGKQDSKEYQILSQRLKKQVGDKDGVSLTFNEDGSLASLQIGGAGDRTRGLAESMTPNRVADEQEQLDALNSTVAKLDRTIEAIEARPSTAGPVGAVRSFAQDLVGVVEDIDPVGLTDVVKQGVRNLPGMTEDIAEDIDPFFDPRLPETQIHQNTIALELAKLRIKRGRGSIRALKEAFDTARQDTKIRGLRSSKSVLVHLREIRKEFEEERDNLQSRIFTGRRDETPEVSDDALLERLNSANSEEEINSILEEFRRRGVFQ